MAVAGNDRKKGSAFELRRVPFLHYWPKISWGRPEKGRGQSPYLFGVACEAFNLIKASANLFPSNFSRIRAVTERFDLKTLGSIS